MSTSHSCEDELRRIASDLYAKAAELEQAAEVLRVLRETVNLKDEIASAKKWAKDWMR